MLFTRSILICASLVAQTIAQTTSRIAFTSLPQSMTAGQQITLSWGGGDGSVSICSLPPALSLLAWHPYQTDTAFLEPARRFYCPAADKTIHIARHHHSATRHNEQPPDRPAHHRFRLRHLLHVHRPRQPAQCRRLRFPHPARRFSTQLHRHDHPDWRLRHRQRRIQLRFRLCLLVHCTRLRQR